MTIRRWAAAAALGLTLAAGVAVADVTVTVQQVGPNVVLIATGSINTSGLTYYQSGTEVGSISGGSSQFRIVVTGEDFTNDKFDQYLVSGTGTFVSPFTTSVTSTSSTTGTTGVFGVTESNATTGRIDLPQGYVSGATLTSITDTYNNKTLAQLGFTPGVYVEQIPNNTITFNVLAVPEPGVWSLMIAGVGLTGAALRSRRSRSLAAAA